MNDQIPTGGANAPNPPALEALPGVAGDIPEAFAFLMEEVGSQTELQVSVSRLEDTSGRWALVHSGARVLSAHEVGGKFGSGEYRETVQWRTQGAIRGPMKKREVVFVIGREYGLGQGSQPAQAPPAPVDTAKELDRVLDLASKVVSLSGRGGSDQLAPVIGLVEKLMDRMDRDREADRTRFDALRDEMRALLSKGQGPAPARGDLKEELRDLIALGKELGVPGVQNMGGSNEEPKPVWMGAVEIIGENVGKFLETLGEMQKSKAAQIHLLATSRQARTVLAAKPHFDNPATRVKMIEQLDSKVGKETTDKILQGLGVTR